MDGYNFWQDFFDTYQSLSNGTKALWLIVPPAFVLGLVALILRHRVAIREVEHGLRGDLIYTIHRDANDQLHVTRHGAALQRAPAVVLLEERSGGGGEDRGTKHHVRFWHLADINVASENVRFRG